MYAAVAGHLTHSSVNIIKKSSGNSSSDNHGNSSSGNSSSDRSRCVSRGDADPSPSLSAVSRGANDDSGEEDPG